MPKPLSTKLIATIAIGFACLFLGIVYFTTTKDTIFLLLSVTLLICSLVKAMLLYQIIKKKNYILLCGTCIELKRHPIRRTSVITFQLEDDSIFELTLDRSMKLHTNSKYELYFEVDRIAIPDQQSDASMRFLCLERL